MIGQETDRLYQFSVSVPFDMGSDVKYTGLSFSVNSEDNAPHGFAFNDDGTKFFMMGNGSNTAYEYTLTNPFDLSVGNVVYSTNSFSVNAQATAPKDIEFSTDGLRFFIVESISNMMFEYTLTNPFDLSSGNVVYSTFSFDVSVGGTLETTVESMAWNPNGLGFVVVGFDKDRVYEFSVVTAFDLSSTVAYTGNNSYVGRQDHLPTGVTWGAGGTRFYIVGVPYRASGLLVVRGNKIEDRRQCPPGESAGRHLPGPPRGARERPLSPRFPSATRCERGSR